MGGSFMSTDIIQFIRRPRRDSEQTDFPTIAFRCAVPGHISDHVEMASCDVVVRESGET
jgi:hypothetical protein